MALENKLFEEGGPNRGPITARFATPWLDDNLAFILELQQRQETIGGLRQRLRPLLIERGVIATAHDAPAEPLAAVDASVQEVPLDDLYTVLVQAVLCRADGSMHFDKPVRYGPSAQNIARLTRTPARAYREAVLLSTSATLTIADNSLWSFLMDINQAFTAQRSLESELNKKDTPLHDVLNEIPIAFERMINNASVIALPKSSLSNSFLKRPEYRDIMPGVLSDRETLTLVLDENEYITPQPLSAIGKFGVHNDIPQKIRERLETIYSESLYFTYYKPWSFQRVYRVEGHKSVFVNSLFASIKEVTKYRGIIEPVPQFLADRAVSQLSGVAMLYGDLNRFRTPFMGFHRTAR